MGNIRRPRRSQRTSHTGRSRTRTGALFTVLALAAVALPGTANATHDWGGYHWARTSSPFTLQVGDNVNSLWDVHLATSESDWDASSVLGIDIIPGATSVKRCSAASGYVQVCNASYGKTGWLGIAGISISGGQHITSGYVKLNDTYFNTAKYNTPAWRNVVMCQEIGHTFGLGHQDEDFTTSLGSCMDYSNNAVENQHPNAHDYAMLESKYAHLDGSNSYATAAAAGGDPAPDPGPGKGKNRAEAPADWGREVAKSHDGRVSVYEKAAGDVTWVTHVTWALDTDQAGDH